MSVIFESWMPALIELFAAKYTRLVGKLLTMPRAAEHLPSLIFWVPMLNSLSNDGLSKLYVTTLEAMATDGSWARHLRLIENAMRSRGLEV